MVPLWSNERIERWVIEQMEAANQGRSYPPGNNVPPTWADVDSAMRHIRDSYELYIVINRKANKALLDKLQQIKELIDE